MSRKTNFKRIALVAAASVTMGLMSTLPSAQAGIIGTPTVTATNGSSTSGKSDSLTAGSLAVSFFSQNSTDSAVITLTGGAKPAGTFDSRGVTVGLMDTTAGTVETTVHPRQAATAFTLAGSVDTTVANYLSPASNTNLVTIKSTGLGTAYGKIRVYIDSATTTRTTAGDFTIPYTVEFYSNGVLDATKSIAGTITITNSITGVAAAGAVTAAATSSAVMYTGTSFVEGNTVDSTVAAVSTPDGSTAAVIRITQKTAAGAAGRESITATIDKGNLKLGSAVGKSLVLEANVAGVDDLLVLADGQGGTGTITLKTTSVTFANKTVSWYAPAANITSITVTKLGNTIGSTAANVLLAVAKDASGTVNQSTLYAIAADRTIIATTATTGTACSYVAAYGGNVCSLSGATDGSTTITVWNGSSAATRTVSGVSGSITVSTKAPVAIKLATDKTSYAPGEVAYVRVWAVDASGNPVSPGSFTNLLAAGGVTSTVAMGNSSDTTSAVSFSTGFTTSADGYASAEAIKLYKVYMPATGGDITFSATGGSLLPASGQVAVTAKVTVTDSGAAALAAVTALASQVSAFITKINAQITTLTDLVMKIQKKVKA